LPTIHLSIPEAIYEKLRSKSEEMGIQVTDLVKVFIRKGLEEGREEKESVQKYEESIAFLEAKVAQLEYLVAEMGKRLREEEQEGELEPEVIKP
jgi:hypothetical protein